MTNDQIRTWIMSVYTPNLKNWYHECLSVPANQYHLIAAQKVGSGDPTSLHENARAIARRRGNMPDRVPLADGAEQQP
jgi:hypothetical protein